MGFSKMELLGLWQTTHKCRQSIRIMIGLYTSRGVLHDLPMALSGEHTVALLAILVICAWEVYRLAAWVMAAPRTADPWGPDIELSLNRDDAVPVCHHCFTPQEHNGWFCPTCGAIVGRYGNYMPYVRVFAIGEVLRAGTTKRVPRSALITIGFILLSIDMFAVAAPVYWFFLFRNLRRLRPMPPAPPS